MLPKCPCWTYGLPCVVYFLSWSFCVSLLLREGNGVCVYVGERRGGGEKRGGWEPLSSPCMGSERVNF